MIAMNQMKIVLILHYNLVVENWNINDGQRKTRDEEE